MVMKEMSWEKLKPEFVAAYAEVFSEQEMHDLAAFYKTPLGQKVLDKMPQLSAKGMQIAQKHMAEIMPKIQSMAKDAAAQGAAGGGTGGDKR
jgi:hypothetical protein